LTGRQRIRYRSAVPPDENSGNGQSMIRFEDF
jgi:hypothetical protein